MMTNGGVRSLRSRRPTADRQPPTADSSDPQFSPPPAPHGPQIAIWLTYERPIVSFSVRLATRIWHTSVEICHTFAANHRRRER